MKKPIIAIVSETFPPDLCGVADYVNIVAHRLSTLYDVHVITRAVETVKSYDLQGVTIHEVMKSKLYVIDVIQILKQIQPDLIDLQLAYSLAANHLNRLNLISSLTSLLIRRLIKAKLVCTIHELSSLLQDGHSVGLRKIYRNLRDYLATRSCDYYFCVDRKYLAYLKHDRKVFLPNFSNIPSLVHKSTVSSHCFLYFGTLAPHKNIESLLNLFSGLLRRETDCQLFLVGGLTQQFDQTGFQQALANFPVNSVQYLGHLDIPELTKIVADCSYAIFPFPVTDKNASVLAMLVNGLVTIAESESETIFEQYGNTFYKTPELTGEFVYQVMRKTARQPLDYATSDQLLNQHIELRRSVYESLISSPA